MSKDDATWLNVCYVIFMLCCAYVGYKAVYTLGIQFGWSESYDSWYQMFSNVFALVFGAGAAFWLRSSQERREYHLASLGELRKVVWPSAEDTKRMTLIVVVVVAVFAVILGAFDVFWSWLLKIILS